MRKPSSNPQSLSLLRQSVATLRASFPATIRDGRRLTTSRGRAMTVAAVLLMLALGGISLATLTRTRERTATNKKTDAISAIASETTQGSPSPAATTRADVNSIPATEERKSEKSRARKLEAPAPQQPKGVAPLTVEVKQTPATPAPANQILLSPPATGAEHEEEDEDAGIGRARASWFFDQRAYPINQIPAGALQRAIEQRDAMKQRQREAARSKVSANAVISLPGDALWHLMGPQPVNEPFSVNSGFPTASGRVTAVAVDPSDATGNTVYIGAAAGGVWKTTDGGANWTVLTDTQPSLSIGSITIDPNNHNTIYVGTGEENFNGDAFYGAGILKSTDGGTTWAQIGASTFAQALGPNTGGAFIGQIAVQPGNSQIVLAAVSFFVNGTIGGIYRSTDGGANWTEDAAPQGLAATSVVFEPTVNAGTNATAWMAMGDPFGQAVNGVYKSTDSGLTWTKQTGTGANILPTAKLGRIILGYAQSTSGAGATVYGAIADSSTSSSSFLGFFKTIDGGTNWTTLAATPAFCNQQCFYDMAVGVNPANASFVVVGGGAFTNNSTSLFKTTDGGATWTGSTAPNDFTLGSTNVRPHVDTHAFSYSASGAKFYVGNDGGMWRTDNPGTTPPLWVNLNATLAITQFYPGPSAGISDENYGFGGTQDNDTELFSGTLDWTNVFACGDGGFTAIDAATPTTVYTGCDKLAGNVIRKSVFNGAVLAGPSPTFNGADNGINRSDAAQFIPPLKIDTSDPNNLYFGTCRVWAANDAATSLTPTWNAISGDLSQAGNPTTVPCNSGSGNAGSITTIDVAESDSSVIVAGTSNGKVWETLAGGAFWTEIDNLVPGQLPARHVTSVRTKGGDATGQIVYVTFSGFGACAGCGATPGHVFKTINGGASWTNISGDLPDIPVDDMIVDHMGAPAHDALYIATDVGVFSCPDPEAATPCTNWTVIGDGLPNSPVLGLAMRQTSRILRAATHGRSMWQIQLTDVSPPSRAFLSSITPAAVMAGAPTTAVVANGFNLSANTQVQFNGSTTGVATTFVNTTQLNVTLNSSLLQVGGVFQITLLDPAGVEQSSTLGFGLPFAVMNPVLNPQTMTPGTALTYTPVHFHLTGNNFVAGTVLAFFDTSNVLQFQLQGGAATGGGTVFDLTTVLTQFTTPFTYNVVPFNPTPGGGINPNALAINGGPVPFSFVVTANPNPLAIVNPNPIVLTAALGTTSQVLTVSITNFGGAALNITAQSITGTNLANFSFAAPAGGTSCNFPTSGQSGVGTITLTAGGGTCNFGITYTAATPPGNANSVATLNLTDNGSGNPQAIPITGIPLTSGVFLFPVNFGSVGIGATSPTMNTTLINTSSSTVTVSAPGFVIGGGTNPADFHIVPFVSSGDGFSACPALPFPLAKFAACDVSLNFTPSLAGNESSTIQVTDNATGSPQNAALIGVGVQITSISPSIVATGGPAFTLTVNGGGFAPSAVVNVNGSARLTTFVNATQLKASIPASDIATAGSRAISVTTPVPGGTQSEPKTLLVAQATSATNDNINFATVASPTPFRISQDTTQATINTAVNDPAPACAPGGATQSGKARSVWFKFVAPATGRVIADTRFSTYTTILSAWTGTPGSLVAVASACASGNIASVPTESFIGFPVTNGTTYFLMVTDATATGLGGTLTFSLDFATAAPANDDNTTPTVIAPASLPFSNTVNTILATANTNAHLDPALPGACATGAASSGQANSVWYSFTPTSSGTVTADTLTSPYDTILNVTSGSPAGTQVACNDNAGAGIAQAQVSFAATSGTTYFFMVSSFLGDGGNTNFHLTFGAGGVGAASKLAVTVQPTNTAAGASITPAVQVTIQDASGNTVTTATNSVTMAIGTNPGGGTLSGTATVAAVNGIATFSNLNINKTGTGYTLAASATGLTGATSNAFNITPGAASKLAVTVQPTNTAAGASITPPVQVTIQDAGGNTVTTATNAITMAIGTNPGGGTLSGTATVAAVNGVATFSNLSINKTGTGYTLAASATGLTGATSNAFNITPGAATKLVFSVQPTNVGAGSAITPAVQVTIQDAQGNTVTGATNSIAMAIGTNPGAGTLSGTTSVAAVNGVATFSTLSINNAGVGYTLAASATVLTGATSTAFNVTSGTAAKLTFTVQPASAGAGSSITPAVQVAIQDAGGNTVTTATNSVTVAIGTNPASGTLSGTLTVAAVNGIATFSNLSINNVGTGYTLGATAGGLTSATSAAFNITSGTATKLAITVQPTNTAAGASITPAVQVTIQDASGNTVTSATNSVTMAIGTNPGGGTLSGTTSVAAVNGVATFSNLSINKTGTGYTLAASATGLTSATSGAFNITPGAATKLAFNVQPTNTAAGAAITPAVQATIQDAAGNTVTTATNAITMAIGTNPGGGTLSGTTTVAAVNGIATFSTLNIDKTGTGYTLASSATGLTGATSGAFNITPGTAAKLAITVQPTSVAAGAAITPAIQVTIQDAGGNTVTTATNSVTMSIGTNPGGGTLSGTTSVAAVAGVATFSTLSINKTGTGYTLAAGATGLTGATSNAFNVTAGVATKLAVTVQPTNVGAGAAITPAVQVTIQDAGGNIVTTANNAVTMAIGTNPGGGTLSGTATVAAVNGVATFSTLSINKVGTGYTLAATATGLTGATSAAFNVTAGTATKLAVTVQPTNVATGASITPAVQVTIQDAGGNTVTTATNSVTMAIGTNPGGGTLSGTTTVAAVNGVATFSTLSINKVGTGYTLAASATGLTGATSNAFNVTAGAGTKLAFTVQPTNVAAGTSIAPAVQVTIQDAGGNTVTTATNSITMAIGTNPGGGALSGTTTVAAVGGVATFSNLSINFAGAGYTLAASATGLTGSTSSAFNVTSGSAAKNVFTVQPSSVGAGSVITPAVQVTIEDALGNTVTAATNAVTIAIGTNPAGGTLTGTTTVNAVNGVATFSNLSINNAGAGYTLTGSATGLTVATSNAFSVTSGTAAKLAFTVQPSNVGAGVAISPAVSVAVQDAQGNTVTSAANAVTIAIGTNPGGGTLSGTATANAVNGIATFSSLSINNLGTGYTLTASATGLTGATSTAFNVLAGVPTKVVLTVQPTNTVAGSALTPAVQATIQDAGGNPVTTATNAVTIGIGTNPSGGTLSGTVTVNAVAGVATFSTLNINRAGTGYTLAASATGLTGATSSAFNVTAGVAAKLAFTVQPSNVGSGASITPAVQVAVEDANGNLVITATNAVTIAIGTNPTAGTLSGTATVNAIAGVATFANLSINNVGVGYTLSASATGLTAATSTGFNVTAGAPAKAVFTVQPSNVSAGAAISPAVQVTIEDAQGNTVTTANNAVTAAIGTNPAAGTLSGTTTVNAVNGVATFSTLGIDKLGTGYTLTASATGLTGATSNAFNVTAGAATKLIFTIQPSNAASAAAITPAVKMTITDAGGNPVSSATNAVTMAIGTNPGGGTLSGTVTVNAVSGVATFSTLNINKAGTGYVLAASATGLTSATSSAFNITAGPPAKITANSGTPQNAIIGAPFAAPFGATVTDAAGNPTSGTVVTFTPPGAGASGTFAGGLNTATTNAGGLATSAIFTANATAGGPYNVVASAAGATSASFVLTNNNPVPVITPSLSPTNTTAGAAAFTLTITGTNFVAGATVNFGSNPALTPTSITPTQIVVTVPAADIVTGGTPNVTVTNPAPGGGTSAAATFTINNPLPVLSSATVGGKTHAAGGTAFTLTIVGAKFVATSVVNFNGKAETTHFGSGTQLTADIPAADVATAGTFSVTVTNPLPGGGTTTAMNFTVDGFTVTAPATPPPVKAGQVAMITITVTPSVNGFTSTTPVSFTVAGLPAQTTSSFSPTTVSPGTAVATTTLTITTKANSAVPPSAPLHPPTSPLLRLLPVTWLALLLAGLYATFALRRSPQLKRYAAIVPLSLLLVTGAVLAGCAGGMHGTPTGPAPLVVTATSGSLSQTANVTLTVQ